MTIRQTGLKAVADPPVCNRRLLWKAKDYCHLVSVREECDHLELTSNHDHDGRLHVRRLSI
jgi:hypothetical protein